MVPQLGSVAESLVEAEGQQQAQFATELIKPTSSDNVRFSAGSASPRPGALHSNHRQRIYTESAPVSMMHTPVDGSRSPATAQTPPSPTTAVADSRGSGNFQSGLVLRLGGSDNDGDGDGGGGGDDDDDGGGVVADVGSATVPDNAERGGDDGGKGGGEVLVSKKEAAAVRRHKGHEPRDPGTLPSTTASMQNVRTATTAALDLTPPQWNVRSGPSGSIYTSRYPSAPAPAAAGERDAAVDAADRVATGSAGEQGGKAVTDNMHARTRGAARSTSPLVKSERVKRDVAGTEAAATRGASGAEVGRRQRVAQSVGSIDLASSSGRSTTPHRRHSRRHVTQLENEFEHDAHAETFYTVSDAEMRGMHTPLRSELSLHSASRSREQGLGPVPSSAMSLHSIAEAQPQATMIAPTTVATASTHDATARAAVGTRPVGFTAATASVARPTARREEALSSSSNSTSALIAASPHGTVSESSVHQWLMEEDSTFSPPVFLQQQQQQQQQPEQRASGDVKTTSHGSGNDATVSIV